MKRKNIPWAAWGSAALLLALTSTPALAEAPPSSYAPVVDKMTFEETVEKLSGEKAATEEKHQSLLEQRYGFLIESHRL